MDEARRGVLGALGVALFVAGVAVGASWFGTVQDEPSGKHLSVVNAPVFWVACLLVACGAWVFAAAMTERVPFPGMGRVRERSRQHALAQLILGQAVMQGVWLRLKKNPAASPAEVVGWTTAVREFLAATWGDRETVLLRASLRQMSAGTDASLALRVIEPTLGRLEDFMARCHTIPLRRDAKPINVADWSKLLIPGTTIKEDMLPRGKHRRKTKAE